ncbi:HSP30 [Paramicrosporidium saccamoebae]|uniref:HSP30 n=1 Tax=Paramicrosporidium saccamoebae TaxID=1246581 RepID=A0A2H9TQM9_9FUNG|nr:HSP30 [Paramicrosporidium saccamoebae]
MMDPFDLDAYVTQRMRELFGPDVEALFPARTPVIRQRLEEEDPEELLEQQPTTHQLSRMARQFIPIDIYESEDGYMVEASLPGVPKDKIEAHVDHNNVLSILARPSPLITHACGQSDRPSGKEVRQPVPPTPQESPSKDVVKSKREEDVPHNFLLSERQRGKLYRSIRLPKHADAQNVKTCLENGILCLSFSKLPSAEVSHQIEIK